MNCRSCNHKLKKILLDLGQSPIANSLISSQKIKIKKFNLKVFICQKCWLLQTNDLVNHKRNFLKVIIHILVVTLKPGSII